MGALHCYERYMSARLLDITSQKTVISRFLFGFLRVFFFYNSLTFHLLCRHSQTATSWTLLLILRNNKTRKVGGTWKLTWKLIGGKCGRGVGTNVLTYLQSARGDQRFVICGPWTSCGPRTFSLWCACVCSATHPHTHTRLYFHLVLLSWRLLVTRFYVLQNVSYLE